MFILYHFISTMLLTSVPFLQPYTNNKHICVYIYIHHHLFQLLLCIMYLYYDFHVTDIPQQLWYILWLYHIFYHVYMNIRILCLYYDIYNCLYVTLISLNNDPKCGLLKSLKSSRVSPLHFCWLNPHCKFITPLTILTINHWIHV